MPELPFVMEEGDRMVRAAVDGEILAKQGAMVAYTGSVDFAFKGAGLGGFVRKAVTGEGQELMKVTGRGNVWFADNGAHISLFTLEADRLVVNGRSLLVLGQGMSYEIKKTSGGIGAMAAGGLFQTEVTGTGQVAVTCLGTPLVLPTDQPVFVDAQAAVAWT
nr:AIM24 family protein [Actinomycetota bacterium]